MNYGIVLTIMYLPTFDNLILTKREFIVNTSRPVPLPTVELENAFRRQQSGMPVIADKATLLNNSFDLCEEDFLEYEEFLRRFENISPESNL